MSIWDDPDIRPDNDYVKFENEGDSIVATVEGVSVHTFPDGKRAPKLQLVTDSGERKTLTAGQVQLKSKLGELRPEVGDRVAIVLKAIEKRDAGRTLKVFDVQVKRSGADLAAAQPQPAAAGVSADDLL